MDCGHEHSELDSEEEEEEDDDGDHHRHPAMQFSPDSLQMTRRDGEYYGNARPVDTGDEWEAKSLMTGHHHHHHHHASIGGADGYDSFENMSNKKKRKIPQSGVGGHGHSNSLSADMANITLSPSLRDGAGDADDGHGQYAAGNSYGYVHNSPGGSSAAAAAAAAATGGLSGPGRGRYGRSGRGSMDRRPLGASTNGLNASLAHHPKPVYAKPGTGTSYPLLPIFPFCFLSMIHGWLRKNGVVRASHMSVADTRASSHVLYSFPFFSFTLATAHLHI